MDVWMVIGRPNVMELLIRRLPRIGHSYNIQDPLRAASLYNTLLRDGSPVFVQDLRLHATKKQLRSNLHPVYIYSSRNRIMIRQTCLILPLALLLTVVWTFPQQPKSRRPIPQFKVCHSFFFFSFYFSFLLERRNCFSSPFFLSEQDRGLGTTRQRHADPGEYRRQFLLSGQNLRILRRHGERLSNFPRLHATDQGFDQVELHLPRGDGIQSSE